MHKLQAQLFLVTAALIVSWILFFGFGVYTWTKLNAINKYSVTYDCDLANQVDTTPIEVRAKCDKLKK